MHGYVGLLDTIQYYKYVQRGITLTQVPPSVLL